VANFKKMRNIRNCEKTFFSLQFVNVLFGATTIDVTTLSIMTLGIIATLDNVNFAQSDIFTSLY
jgi:hypothetical protein